MDMKLLSILYGFIKYMHGTRGRSGGSGPLPGNFNFFTFSSPLPPLRQIFCLYRFVYAVIKKRPDDHYSFVRCMVHTPWHSVVEADFKHVILLSREGKLPFLGIILLIENMTLGICHLFEI